MRQKKKQCEKPLCLFLSPYWRMFALTFELVSVKKEEGVLCLYLEKKNITPMEHRSSGIHSKGFQAEIRVSDFPLRGKKVLLCIKKRRWENITTGKIIQRDWSLLSQGTLWKKIALQEKQLQSQHLQVFGIGGKINNVI